MKLAVEFRPDWGQLILGSRLRATGSVDFHDQLLLYLPMKTDHLYILVYISLVNIFLGKIYTKVFIYLKLF